MLRRLLLCLALATGLLSAPAFKADHYSPDSRLAQGRWVKISTTGEGIYQLTYAQLEAMGFADPSQVQVYGCGGVASASLNNAFSEDYPDDIQPVATLHRDGRILFFGQGDHYAYSSKSAGDYNSFKIVRNFYDAASYYFLSDAAGVREVPVRAPQKAGIADPIYNHLHVDFIEEDLISGNGGGVAFFGKKASPGTNQHYRFKVKNYKAGKHVTSGSFIYRYGISTSSSAQLSMKTSGNVTKVNSSLAESNTQLYNTSQNHCSFGFASGHLYFNPTVTGSLQDETVTFTVSVPDNPGIAFAAVDHVGLRYPRANTLGDDNMLILNFNDQDNKAGQTVVFPDTDKGELAFWDIESLSGPSAYPTSYSSSSRETSFVLDHNETLRIIAFRPSATFPSPEIIGETANQNLHSLPVPDMLIVTNAEIAPIAEQLADLHRKYQGMDVAVVDHKLIYNEFGSGGRDAMAIRRMAKMFYDRDPKKFKYLFFFGPAYFDNRGITIESDADRMVCYTQDIPEHLSSYVLNYSTDAYFSMLADDYTHNLIHMTYSNIAVGRVPAANAGDAASYYNKLRRRFENPPSPEVYNNVLLIAGGGDKGVHISHQQQVDTLMHKYNPALAFNHAYYQLYAGDNDRDNIVGRIIRNQLTKGTGYISYSGHGSPTSISGWDNTSATNHLYDNYPFVVIASCDQFDFDHMNKGLVETMIFNEKGGALGGFAADRSVYISYNQIACLPMAKAYSEATEKDNFGELYVNTRNYALDCFNIYDYKDYFTSPARIFCNLLSYNLAGDPAVPVGSPSAKAAVTSLGGRDTSTASDFTLEPLVEIPIEGHIQLADGAVDESFNGTAKIRIYEAPKVANTLNTENELGYISYQVAFDSDLLCETEATVTAGRFSATVTPATPARPGLPGRIVVTAASAGNAKSATGLLENVTVNDIDPDKLAEAGVKAPEIKQLYAGAPEFIPGDEVGASIAVTAVVDPSKAGLSFRGGDIASTSRMSVDGKEIANFNDLMRRTDDGLFEITLNLENLAEGSHTAELTVVNNLGMSDYAAISFTVAAALEDVLAVDIAEEPARTRATISLNAPGRPSRLIITDRAGRTVHTVPSPALPISWNLTDLSGTPVPDGVYKASLLLDDNTWATGQIVVLR